MRIVPGTSSRQSLRSRMREEGYILVAEYHQKWKEVFKGHVALITHAVHAGQLPYKPVGGRRFVQADFHPLQCKPLARWIKANELPSSLDRA